jgi:GntR family transcriptional regulator
VQAIMAEDSRAAVSVRPSELRPWTLAADSGRPRYAQLRDSIVRRITAGEWRSGDMLPSELAVAAEYGVAPGTVRKAFDQLVANGVILRQHGRGTFVATFDWPGALTRFFRMAADDGSREMPVGQVVRHEAGPATRHEAERLSLPNDARVIRFVRLRMFGSVPTIVERFVVPYALFPDLGKHRPTMARPGLYEYYGRKYGILITHARENLRAVAADEEDAELLGLDCGAPLLEIDRLAMSMQERAVEWRISRCNTAKHHYRTELT